MDNAYKEEAHLIEQVIIYKDRLKLEMDVVKRCADMTTAVMMLLEAERNEVYGQTLEEHRNRVISKTAMLRNAMDLYLLSKDLLDKSNNKTVNRMARMARKVKGEK